MLQKYYLNITIVLTLLTYEKFTIKYIYQRGFLKMRVISGVARGTKLISQEGLDTRRTLDRVKEALFSIIQFDLEGKSVLDLFAGSGALGIEALSRGAKKAVFCDKDIKAIKAITKNVQNTKFENQSVILRKDYNLALKQLCDKKNKFDFIFLDPPYKTDFAVKAIDIVIKYDLLTKDGIIVLETNDINKKNDILLIDGIEIYDERKYGNVILIFIRKE